MNFCKNGECSRCGACCTPFLPMTKSEVKTVKEYLKKNPQIRERALNQPFFKENNVYVRCCFYDDDKKECMIYPVRPFICRAYKCNQDDLKIENNKNFIYAKAHYNTEAKTIHDFRSLLFNDYRMVVLAVGDETKKNPDQLLEFFKELGRYDVAVELEKQIRIFKENENENKE